MTAQYNGSPEADKNKIMNNNTFTLYGGLQW